VELLVVITIIGILAALITAAGVGALKTAQRNRIKVEINQMDLAIQSLKDTLQSYPTNCQVDGTSGSDVPLNESQVLTDLKRQFKQAFPRHREPDFLIAALAGLTSTGAMLPNNDNLQGGMSAGESLVFWLGGFSNDPKYPISGEGGPAYPIPAIGDPDNNTLDPIESRKWVFPFDVARLRPRTADNFFDNSDRRFIEYTVNINGVDQRRRINFWQYVPAKSEQPYLYFDTSRHPATIPDSSGKPVSAHDPPAATNLNPNALHVHAVKKRSESAADNSPIQFSNQDKFQILHAGIDEEWGAEAFEMMSAHGVENAPPPGNDPSKAENYLLFPDGPFTGDVADTLTNFSEGTLEASQP
jgi:type II secretory pathway pseudopilin PulG